MNSRYTRWIQDKMLLWEQRYRSFQPRQQLMLALLALVLAWAVFFWGIWEPVRRHLAEAQDAYVRQRDLLVWLQEKDSGAPQAPEAGPTMHARTPLPILLTDTAKNYAISIKRLEMDKKGTASLMIENAQFNQLIRWLDSLAHTHHAVLLSVIITKTASPGMVDAAVKITYGSAAGAFLFSPDSSDRNNLLACGRADGGRIASIGTHGSRVRRGGGAAAGGTVQKAA